MTYRRSDFRPMPTGLAALLQSLQEFKPAAFRPHDHLKLADSIADAAPFTILLFTEPLAQGHWGRKQYMDMHCVKINSEIDETVFRRFRSELDERMRDYLKDHQDPDDVYLELLLREYRPKARAILRAEYRERYPGRMSVITEPTTTAMTALQSKLHAQCVLCGGDHPQGLRLAFRTHADGHVEATFACDRLYQGYTGYLHGGVISALLDSAMTNCLFAHGRVAMTGELKVRFLKPVIATRPAVVGARLAKSSPPLFHMEAELRQNDVVMARATARFMEVRMSDSGLAPECAVGQNE